MSSDLTDNLLRNHTGFNHLINCFIGYRFPAFNFTGARRHERDTLIFQRLFGGLVIAAITHVETAKYLAYLLAHDSLVGWGWEPGAGLEPAPGTQASFGKLIRAWIDSRAHCPDGEAGVRTVEAPMGADCSSCHDRVASAR